MTTLTRWSLPLLLIAARAPAYAQRDLAGEVEIRQTLERLNTLGSAMMIAAHPDDENTALLAYLARGRHVRAAYLALTRGEGGQNLIGSEQGDEMGIIRTQELLAARRIDGAEQFFTRAIDFGFSKTADETLAKWNRDKVLADVVWNIRRFRPDVVILRFTGTTRDGHGHHQSSAILGREAFSAAADPTKFPEQLAYVKTWQPARLMQNANAGGPGGGGAPGAAAGAAAPAGNAASTGAAPAAAGGGRGGGGRGAGGRGGGRGGAATGPAEPSVDVDLGAYSPELGYSFGEIAGMSRSQHRSQGMGSAERKGAQRNTLTTEVGDKATKDIFEGIDITWARVPGGAEVGVVLKQALDSFVPAHPEELLPLLAKARPLIAAIKDPLAERKLKELDEAMALCAALSLEAQADKFAVSPGANLRVNASAIVRSTAPVTLTGISLSGMQGAPSANVVAPAVLVNNQPSQYPLAVTVPDNQPYSQPYWLAQPKDGTLYTVSDQRLVGNPENAAPLEAHFRVRIAGTDLELTRPVQNRYVDRVLGELIRPLAIVPPVAIDLAENALVFPDTKPRKIDVPVKSNGGKQSGDVRLEVPAGWKVEPASRHFDLAFTDEQLAVSFELTPPQAATRGKVRAVAQVGTHAVSSGTESIQYSHIPTQTLFPPAETPLVRTDVKVLAKNVGYIMGAGDDVPQAIQQLGCEVTLLTSNDLARGDLSKFDAIVTGVRAFNTRPDLRANYQRLFDYASNGGTLVVQYNVAEGGGGGPGGPAGQAGGAAASENAGPLEHVGPYPLRTSRDRVTVEEAPITFPNPQLRILHAPNEITQADFEGWIQERGLYFADQFDEKYKSVLESHDPGEMPLPGGMLYTPYGKGAYVFSAYDWFRELPAGVPGAYRMFANMLSAAKTQ